MCMCMCVCVCVGLHLHGASRPHRAPDASHPTPLTRRAQVCFHLQSVMAYAVMGLISPVSQSVANTLKRALLIWASILYFGNPMSAMSALGTVICISGVLSYNHARRHYPFRHAPAAPSRPTPRLVLPDEARSADIQLMPTGAAPNDAAPRGAGSESLPPSSPNSPTCRAV